HVTGVQTCALPICRSKVAGTSVGSTRSARSSRRNCPGEPPRVAVSGHAAHGVVFAVSAIATLVATGLWRRVALRRNLVHAPGGRRSHTVATPTLGGVGMLAGFLAGMAAAWAMPAFGDVFGASTEPLGLVIAVLVMHAVGAVDEVRKSPAGPAYLHDGLSAPAKMAGMVLSASILALAGITILHFRVPFGESLGVGDLFVLSPDLSFVITVVWVLGMGTALNYL